jgi:YVTN family beta-propeller protein
MQFQQKLRSSLVSALAAAGLFLAAGNAASQTVNPPINVGTSPQAIAINPITNKIYVANDGSNNVTVIDGRTHSTSTLAVGSRPFWIAVNPETNKIFVSNFGNTNTGATPSLMVIDGATHAVGAPQVVGDVGWTTVNPVTNRTYVLRYGGSDEVNIIADNVYHNTAATFSFRPVGLAINPVTNVLYVIHEGTGDVVAMNMADDVPYPPLLCPNGAGGFKAQPAPPPAAAPGPCIDIPGTPVGVAVNPITNKIYTVSSGPSGQIAVINGFGQANPHTFTTLTPPGTTGVAKAVAVNPVTNRIYAAFANRVVVVNGADNTMTVIPSGTTGGPVAVGVNTSTNKIYVPNSDGTLTVIDGATNAASTLAIPTGAKAIAVNPLTNTMYVLAGNQVTPIDGATSDTAQSIPLTTTITAHPGNTSGATGTITMNAASSAGMPSPRKVYYQIDSLDGEWKAAAGTGPYTGTYSGLPSGTHTIYAFATNGLEAPSITTDVQNNPLVGSVAAYTFTVSTSAPPNAGVSSATVDFGGQSMGTTSQPQFVSVTNIGAGTLTVSGISVSNPQFAQTNDCTTLSAGASCTVRITFTPAAAAGELNSRAAVSGTLTVNSNGSSGAKTVALGGTAEKSLVTHYYRSILRRGADSGGRAFWENEAARVAGLGANVNEAWYAMAMNFYASGEYVALARDDSGFVTDLYNTFFNRPPDESGLAYWKGQLANGLPREVALVSFMFSSEFASFTQAIFGNTAARAEVDTVGDFFRGLLARLGDDGGFNFWVGRFRTAQCQDANAVRNQAESISSAFIAGAEYSARNRTNAQYVGDLYNAFLRRGGDLDGVKFWIGQLDSGASSRDQLRQQFVSSPEFTARVNAVIQQGCKP